VIRVKAPRRSTAVWAAAWALAVLLCALGAGSYAGARTDGELGYAKARDDVLAAGRQDITHLNTVDAAHADRDLRQWLDATTGPLHTHLTRTHATDLTSLKQSGTSTRATVTDAAVTELDTRAGTAKVIATLRILLTPRTGPPTTDRKRFDADLARTRQGWRLTALTAVPMGSS
jgi:Mce-associated membrane protein